MDNIKEYLKQIGLSPEEIKTLRVDEGSLCPNCKKRSTRHWAKLKPCNHLICFTCMDNLYDNYEMSDVDTLFECPFCKVKVIDWENNN